VTDEDLAFLHAEEIDDVKFAQIVANASVVTF